MQKKYSLLLSLMLSAHVYADDVWQKYELLSHLASTIGGLNSSALDHSNKSNLARLQYDSKYSEDKPFSFTNSKGEVEQWYFDKYSSRFKFYLKHADESYGIRSWGMFDWMMAYFNDTVYDAKVVGHYFVFVTSYKVGCFNLETKKECSKLLEDKSPNGKSTYDYNFSQFLLEPTKQKNEVYLCKNLSFNAKDKYVGGNDCTTLSLSNYD